MRVVLDANILVAALSARGACFALLERVLAVHLYAIDDNLEGVVVRVLRDKLRLPSEHLLAVRAWFASTAIGLRPPPLAVPTRHDSDDDRLLSLALAFDAEVLVTGDEGLAVLNPWRGIPIVSPRQFWLMDRSAST